MAREVLRNPTVKGESAGSLGVPGARLLVASIATSVLLFAALGVAYLSVGNELALAQTVDSLADTMTGGALLFALVVSRRPPDDDHHFGHQSAEPVVALIVAVLVGVLAAEVLIAAVQSIRSGAAVALGWPLAVVIIAKIIVKLVIVSAATGHRDSPVIRALSVDARNDALVGGLAVFAFLGEQYGDWPSVDGWLAIAVALWIFASGVTLGWESIKLLMGTAPSVERQAELLAVVEKTVGVRRVGRISARHRGRDLEVWVEVCVDPSLSLRLAHDIGAVVERELRREPDVSHADVHIDPDDEHGTAESLGDRG